VLVRADRLLEDLGATVLGRVDDVAPLGRIIAVGRLAGQTGGRGRCRGGVEVAVDQLLKYAIDR